MIAKLLIALSFMAAPAVAEPFSHTGYALGCDETGCTVFAAGFLLQVANDGSTPARIISKLAKLDLLTAVNLKGNLGELGDATAPLTLTGLSVKADDLYQDTLRQIQGEWKPKADDSQFSVQIQGLQWQEISAGEVTASFLITPGGTCADGTAPGGIALSLYMLGGDPSEAACWQVENATDTALTLRDAKGDLGQLVLLRVSN